MNSLTLRSIVLTTSGSHLVMSHTKKNKQTYTHTHTYTLLWNTGKSKSGDDDMESNASEQNNFKRPLFSVAPLSKYLRVGIDFLTSHFSLPFKRM